MGRLPRVVPGPIATMAATVIMLTLLLAACGDDNSTPATTPTATSTPATTPTATATEIPDATPTEPGGGGGFDGTVIADPPPLPTPDAIPAAWPTLSLPATRMSETIVLRYPPSWTVTSSHDRPDAVPQTIVLTSWDRNETTDGIREGGTKIDLIAAPIAEQILCEPVAKTPTTFGGVQGFRDVMAPTTEDRSGIARVHLFQAEHEDFRYCAAAYLGSNADLDVQEQIVAQILSTLRIAGDGGQQ